MTLLALKHLPTEAILIRMGFHPILIEKKVAHTSYQSFIYKMPTFEAPTNKTHELQDLPNKWKYDR